MTKTRWKPGQSGNPKGRKPGSTEIGRLRKSIADHLPEIITKLVVQAKAGDAGAARLLLERVLPPIKAGEQPVPLDLPDTNLAAQGKAVIACAAAGQLSPGQASQLLTGLTAVARLVESEELAARVAALESAQAPKGHT
jgi:hypothetical protein